METTPLLRSKDSEEVVPLAKKPLLKPIHSILLCGFIVSLSFGVTQVPILYVFRQMTCEAYYESHPESSSFNSYSSARRFIQGSATIAEYDRCSIPAIAAGTARAVVLLGCSTGVFGVMNLFVTGRAIKRFGVKSALAFQVLWPAARLAVQNVGVRVGGAAGIIIVQSSQLITIVGGPVGYMLALNTYVAEVSGHRERTGHLGRLQGCNMFGAAGGFLLGGVLADAFGIVAPFEVTLGLFLASTAYVLVFLPYIAPKVEESAVGKIGKEGWITGVRRAFEPLKSIMPKTWTLPDGRMSREYGPPILAVGVFLAVLATGYIPTLLQMYATDVFGFGTKRNSYLVSSHSFLRGMFLIFALPRIIAAGRKVMDKRRRRRSSSTRESLPPSLSTTTTTTEAPALVPEQPDISTEQGQMAQALQDEEEPDLVLTKTLTGSATETFDFDLTYTRFSLLADGVLTLGASLVQHSWQMYLIGAVLPLGAGTSSAAKGTILQMVPPAERTDALSAISLVEMMARLLTTFVFGLVFAAFAGLERTELVFVCNAAVALGGFGVLLFCRFPREESVRVEESDAVRGDDGGRGKNGRTGGTGVAV